MAPDRNSPIRHFRADSPFIKSESAWVAQTYRRLQNYLYEVEEGIPPQILRKQATGNFGKSKQAIFRKIYKFCSNRPHTAPDGAVCRGTAGGFLSTCCEWKKQGDETC